MSRIYNTIGSLKAIQIELVKNNIDNFKTIEELLAFKKEYPVTQQNIIRKHNVLIQNEKLKLEKELQQFQATLEDKLNVNKESYQVNRSALFQRIENLPPTNNKIIPIVTDYWLNFILWSKITLNYCKYKVQHHQIVFKAKRMNAQSRKRHQYIVQNFDKAVSKSYKPELNVVSLKYKVITQINNYIYGAIGEHKVVEVLRGLNDHVVVINDFNYTFDRALRNYYEDSIIKTIQIDHLVIAPSGIFIIETKNWSKHSIANFELKSPIKQVKNARYALQKIVERSMSLSWDLRHHHWGELKVPMRSILALTNYKPVEEFKYVKICTLDKLIGYINYFDAVYTPEEVRIITNYLLDVNHYKNVTSQLTM